MAWAAGARFVLTDEARVNAGRKAGAAKRAMKPEQRCALIARAHFARVPEAAPVLALPPESFKRFFETVFRWGLNHGSGRMNPR